MMRYLIYMAIRVMEMKRILKPTGSIYLHCDDAAVHYLKLLMDTIFGMETFRGNIVWKRNSANNAGKNFGRIVDHILYYARKGFTWNQPFGSISELQLKRYRYMDSDGRRYKGADLTAPGPTKNNFTWRGATPKYGWRHSLERLEELWSAGLIRKKRDGTPALDGHKQYLDQHPGSKVQNLWTDIGRIGNTAKERTGYPTQKPLTLLHRVIKASSNEGDMVLDPFCGCATTCIAAEQLQRRWVGIDISEKAADLVQSRLQEEVGLMYQGAHRIDIPKRTDLGKIPRYNSAENRLYLYGQQGGYCNGCATHFEPRHFHVDHIVPRSKGGNNHISNLQLLCGSCNAHKGKKSHEELIILLTDKGWIKRRQEIIAHANRHFRQTPPNR